MSCERNRILPWTSPNLSIATLVYEYVLYNVLLHSLFWHLGLREFNYLKTYTFLKNISTFHYLDRTAQFSKYLPYKYHSIKNLACWGKNKHRYYLWIHIWFSKMNLWREVSRVSSKVQAFLPHYAPNSLSKMKKKQFGKQFCYCWSAFISAFYVCNMKIYTWKRKGRANSSPFSLGESQSNKEQELYTVMELIIIHMQKWSQEHGSMDGVFNPQEAWQTCDVRGRNSYAQDKFWFFLLGHWPLFSLCKEGDDPKARTCRKSLN